MLILPFAFHCPLSYRFTACFPQWLVDSSYHTYLKLPPGSCGHLRGLPCRQSCSHLASIWGRLGGPRLLSPRGIGTLFGAHRKFNRSCSDAYFRNRCNYYDICCLSYNDGHRWGRGHGSCACINIWGPVSRRLECNRTSCICIFCRGLCSRFLEFQCYRRSAPCIYGRKNTEMRDQYSYSLRHQHSSKWHKVYFFELPGLFLYKPKIPPPTSFDHCLHFQLFDRIRYRPGYVWRPSCPLLFVPLINIIIFEPR